MNKIQKLWYNQSLKRKWAFTSSAVIFVSYAMICIVIFLALKTWLLNNEEGVVNRTVDDLLVFIESQGSNLTIQDIQHNTGLMNSIVKQDQTVRIYNLDGIEVLRINDTVDSIPVVMKDNFERTVLKEKMDNTEILVANDYVQIGRFKGYLQVAYPLTSYYAMLSYVLTAMLIGGLGALLLSASIGYGLAHILMRPIHDLRNSMMKVKENGFEGSVDLIYTSNDEIGELLGIYNAMMSELQIAFTQQQQFVSDASHELRTPVQAIEGHLSMLKRWGKDDPEVLEESLDTSLLEIKRMKILIEELLDLARYEGREDFADLHANVQVVGEQVKKELLTVYPTANIQMNFEKNSTEVIISENALGQILRNIIENGIRYCDITPRILMQSFEKGDYLVIEIRDNGIGIPEADLPFIFNRFYRVDSARDRKSGGTGLGLSITKLLIGKYYGKVEVESKVGVGSTFFIYLPLKK